MWSHGIRHLYWEWYMARIVKNGHQRDTFMRLDFCAHNIANILEFNNEHIWEGL